MTSQRPTPDSTQARAATQEDAGQGGPPHDGTSALFDELDALFGASGYRRTMGLRIVRERGGDGSGDAVIECEVTPPFANTRGVAHGGLITGLIDTAAGVAVKISKGPATPVATVSLTTNFHRPAQIGTTLRAVGRHVSGNGTPFCQVEVHDDGGAHIASGVATLRALRPTEEGP